MIRVLLLLLTTAVFLNAHDCIEPTFKNNYVTFDDSKNMGKEITGCITPATLKRLDIDYKNLSPFFIYIRKQNIPTIKKGAVANFEDDMHVYIDGNNINVVKSGAFFNLPRVTGISLQNNSINTIEVGVFTNLPSLVTIYIQYNKLSMLEPNTFANLPELKTVFMGDNQFEYFEQEWFKDTPKLSSICINNNRIRTLSRATFATIPHLKILVLNENQIEHIHRNAFFGLINLNFLNLSYNKLKALHVNFNTVPLSTLLLQGNNLTYIPATVLDDLRIPIQEIELYGNPLQCACLDLVEQWSRDLKIGYVFGPCKEQKPVCVLPADNEDDCQENVGDDVARELNDLYFGRYNESCF